MSAVFWSQFEPPTPGSTNARVGRQPHAPSGIHFYFIFYYNLYFIIKDVYFMDDPLGTTQPMAQLDLI